MVFAVVVLKIISTQNGLGPEDLIADKFGRESALRMSLNYGAALKGPGEAEVTFFNRPNHLGSLSAENQDVGSQLAARLTDSGLDTEFVVDIKLFVWKKMIMKCVITSYSIHYTKLYEGRRVRLPRIPFQIVSRFTSLIVAVRCPAGSQPPSLLSEVRHRSECWACHRRP